MAQATKELYQSSNGDRWYLVSDAKSEVFIRHEPNASSGGVASDIEIGAFLSKGPRGPEHEELLRLIGTLIDGSPDSRPKKFTIEFFRIREGDQVHAMLARTTHVAADLENAMVKAKSLFLNLEMPQSPDGLRILDQDGIEVFLWKPEQAGT